MRFHAMVRYGDYGAQGLSVVIYSVFLTVN